MSLCALWLKFKTGRLHNRLDFLVGLEWRTKMEIKTGLKKLNEGESHASKGGEYVITEDHSLNDVLRWLVDQSQGDKSEVTTLLALLD